MHSTVCCCLFIAHSAECRFPKYRKHGFSCCIRITSAPSCALHYPPGACVEPSFNDFSFAQDKVLKRIFPTKWKKTQFGIDWIYSMNSIINNNPEYNQISAVERDDSPSIRLMLLLCALSDLWDSLTGPSMSWSWMIDCHFFFIVFSIGSLCVHISLNINVISVVIINNMTYA